jgi:hypothetical protein
MGWIDRKSVWLRCPYLADIFEGCEALEGLQPTAIIVGVDEVVEVRSQLCVAVIMVAFDAGLFDRLVHPFDLAASPLVPNLGEPVLDPVFVAAHVEHLRNPSGCGTVNVACRGGKDELDTIVGEHCVGSVWYRSHQRDQESGGFDPVRLVTSWTRVNLLVRSIAT